jgi:hypothetical protein
MGGAVGVATGPERQGRQVKQEARRWRVAFQSATKGGMVFCFSFRERPLAFIKRGRH